MVGNVNQNLETHEQRAGFGPRIVASLIDLALAIVVPFVIFGFIGPFLPGTWGTVWILAIAVSVVGYSAVTAARGRSPGLAAVNLRLIDERTGRPPGVVRSLLLGIERLIGAAAGVGTVIALFSDPGPSSTRTLDVAISRACMVLLTVTVLGRLWMLVDRHHATLFDRILGLAVVRNEPVAGQVPSARD